ncbi:MAG: tRNA pseudouridine(38-40) synthase TruA [Candidatus Lokiarchaeota archaeon]|nr:tRNA pseudouridine(38-40) synthase TruA [Candidatus Lokiarchaeota archaeon]MBD3202351.1 tRNA pseudouridine(38-40) synthase TruA [Candidatus Lokiarchaeota archaeon]
MSRFKKYLFKYYYIGYEKFYGSQRQKEYSTIEDTIIRALKSKNYLDNAKSSEFQSASRTDRFVSAKSATFSLKTEKTPILMEINSIFPKEIGIWAYCEVSNAFNARYDAIQRHYKYIVSYPLHYLQKKNKFDLGIIKTACKHLQGTHDFQNFSKRDKSYKDTIRTLDSIQFQIIDDSLLIFDFKSQGFLRQQIRRTVKKLLELGKGEISYQEFKNLLDPSEFISYQPATPFGLILWDIKYPQDIIFKLDPKSVKRMKKYFLEMKFDFWLKSKLFRVLEQDNFS